jgi:bifunctional non-homologous end joining protein LigD
MDKRFYEPMLCEDASPDLSRYQGRYGGEWKLDGTRVEALIGNKVSLTNRRGIDYTKRLPDITKPLANLDSSCIVDGEVVFFNEEGRTVFTQSQRRCATSNPRKIWGLLREIPIRYVLWDILRLNGQDLRRKPYTKRKEILQRVVREINSDRILYHPYSLNLEDAYEQAVAKGEEGLVLKQLTSPYQDGKRSRYWLKAKLWNYEFVNVVGFTEGQGKFAGTFGSLILEREGKYVGKAGSAKGVTLHQRRQLTKLLQPFVTSLQQTPKGEPFNATPTLNLEVEVRYFRKTEENGVYRFPVWTGNRRGVGTKNQPTKPTNLQPLQRVLGGDEIA